MFSDLTTEPLWNLRAAIANGCCAIDPIDDERVLLYNSIIIDIWEKSGFGRKLTYEESVLIAQGIRNAYTNLPPSDVIDKWLADSIFSLIGEQETKKDSILSLINVGLIGVFAFIGYKIISKKV